MHSERKVFVDVKTPDDPDRQRSTVGGALRHGQIPTYTSPEVLSLLMQYFAVGLMHGGIPSLVYPMFTAYFRMSGAQSNAVTALTLIGWNIKMFVGVLSDCVPLFGYRRKSWILLGWTLTFVCMVVLASRDHGAPFIKDNSLRHSAIDKTNSTTLSSLNLDAQSNGALVALLCGLSSICFIIADVAADAILVEIAQREPEDVRGRLQSLTYTVRYIGTSLSQGIVGVCLNSKRFGGSFTWDIGVNGMFIVLAAACALLVPLTALTLHEQRSLPSSLRHYFTELWQLVQQRATLQVMLFQFFFQFFAIAWTSTATPYVEYHWVHVQNLHSQLAHIIGGLLFAAGLAATGAWGTHWNWRTATIAAAVLTTVINVVVEYFTIYDVVRNELFYLGVPLLAHFPSAVQMMVTSFVLIEVAEVGSEGVMYALLTTVGNLPISFAPLVANILCSFFHVGDQDVLRDTQQVRNEVAVTYLINHATTVVGCLFVLLLPAQKASVRDLKIFGGYHPYLAALWLVFFLICLAFALTVSVLSMFPSTACLVIAGGKGCEANPV